MKVDRVVSMKVNITLMVLSTFKKKLAVGAEAFKVCTLRVSMCDNNSKNSFIYFTSVFFFLMWDGQVRTVCGTVRYCCKPVYGPPTGRLVREEDVQ